ncbi:chalcone-flavonone isomerase [Chloropicon primus]|uniref:Chalcone-flavonone isomerase n=1 Tax=Chloropicon primus TaxID=1764295 RepID=A0A5B8MCI5_9CHLO|nr:chalcone-flavonone isomerase [Chloropicon primus]UPQ96971.1 chalcone-flavonone isomerase [Chloropicon primus]|mmetsp:Transcript_6695/g.19610  ORF Transcript_6695/g.19610 Transcript_6695/m.19610 type:complete len:274 (-) Transcript_6695:1352-2173(-)|eukprot:QDZ17754.1 chalcone-flavonone isomerase [Chloropicon primus]
MSFLKKKYSLTTALAEKLRLTSLSSSGSKKGSVYAEEYVSDEEASARDSLSPSADEDAKFKREAKTKARYPVELDLSEVDGRLGTPLSFVGAGLRSETFMTVEFWIYTIGLYVEPSKTFSALGKYAGCEAGTLHGNRDFCEDLIAMKDVTRVLRFVITLPGLKAGIVVSQFDKVLLPKMKKKGKEDNYRFIMENMGKAKFKKGTKMLLTLGGDGTVTCICDGEVLGSVTCQTLCRSIMEIYVGDSPVSEDIKEKICNGLHATVLQEEKKGEEE